MTEVPPNPGPPPGYGPLPDMLVSARPPRRRRRVAVVAVVGGLSLAGLGVGVAAASTGSSPTTPAPAASPSSGSAAPAPGVPEYRGPFGGKGFGRVFGGPGPGGGPFGALHGEFVTVKSGGGYQTIDTQQGVVTAVSTSSVTLKSDDGFTKTYAVTGSTVVDANRDGISSVKNGDRVALTATVSGGNVTTQQLTDITNLRALGDRLGRPGSPDAPGIPEPTPTK